MAYKNSKLIDSNRAVYNMLLKEAGAYKLNKDVNSSLMLMRTAAHWAWMNHCGFFYDPVIEQMAIDVSLAALATDQRNLLGDKKRILHILSEAHQIGGHTRLVYRWINQDKSEASVLITNQGNREVPDSLEDAVADKGGKIYLVSPAKTPLEQAAEIRSIASSFDHIVLNIHPYDILPIVALGKSKKSIIFNNHADHVFWIGSSISRIVICIRDSAVELCIKRRGIKREDIKILPIVLERSTEVNDLVRSRAEDGAAIILSIASAYKYGYKEDNELLLILKKLVKIYPNVEVKIVGPSRKGFWKKVYSETGGRISAEGIDTDLGKYMRKADIYVDSFPFASLTSLLEAGQHALPVVSLAPYKGLERVMFSDDPALTDFDFSSQNGEELLILLSAYISNKNKRSQDGIKISENINRIHSGKLWQSQLKNIYEISKNKPSIGLRELNADIEETSDIDSMLIDLHMYMREAIPFKIIGTGVSSLNMIPRLDLWRKAWKQGIRMPLYYLLGTRLRLRLLKCWTKTKRGIKTIIFYKKIVSSNRLIKKLTS